MPLRDHFRPPVDDLTSWEGFHGQWPAMLVIALNRKLPRRYVASPRVHFGDSSEIDVATFDEEDDRLSAVGESSGNGGGVATAVWAPPKPTLAAPTDFPSQDVYEVRVFDQKRGRRLVAAVEIVSPANKDRPEHRAAFVAKCAALLQAQVSVVIIDLVTTRKFNLYGDLVDLMGLTDPFVAPDPPSLYAVACRGTRGDDSWLIETWAYALVVGRSLPTMPLWLADNFALPLELEANYEETCRILRIP
ncbi:MAG TPA: DUF4058 family protein [Gemmataceae bacterium]|nr:DUF4058 family protein [Gemmataceae bacterium]